MVFLSNKLFCEPVYDNTFYILAKWWEKYLPAAVDRLVDWECVVGVFLSTISLAFYPFVFPTQIFFFLF